MHWTDRIPPPTRRRLRVLAWRTRRPVAALCAGLAVLLAVERFRPPDPPTVEVLVAARDLAAGSAVTRADVVWRVLPVALVPPGLASVGGGSGESDADGSGGGGSGESDEDRSGGRGSGEGGSNGDQSGGAGRPGEGVSDQGGSGGGATPRPAIGEDDADGLVTDVLGRTLAVAVPEGLPLVPGLLIDDDATPPEGTVVVPVRFADTGVAAVLRPGMRVDVVAAGLHDGSEPERLARDALVLDGTGARSGAGDDGSGGGSGSGGSAGSGNGAGSGGGSGGGLLGGGGAGAGSGTADVPVLLAVTPEESVVLSGASGSRALGAVIVG